MTKDEILKEFNDINHMYNDCTRLDTLSKMLDELLEGHETVTEFADRCKECGKLKRDAEYKPSGDLINREETLTAFSDYVGSGMSMNDFDALWDIVAKMPAVKESKTETTKPETVTEFADRCRECGRERVLAKIRDEIEQLTITEGGYDYTRKMAELYSLKIKVLQIIDKYKTESEE